MGRVEGEDQASGMTHKMIIRPEAHGDAAAEIKAGELWENRLRDELENSRNDVFVFGKNAANSSRVVFMTEAAMDSNKPIIPITQSMQVRMTFQRRCESFA